MSKVRSGIRNMLLKKHKVFGRSEYNLARARLLEDEYIKDCVYGSYQGGSGILVLTNKRVMIVDRRPFFDYFEEATYESIKHFDYLPTQIGGAVRLQINNTFVLFRSLNESKMRNMYALIQFAMQVKEKESESTFRLPDTDHEPEQKTIRPLRFRPRRHPAWNPHNPIMVGVIRDSGVSIFRD